MKESYHFIGIGGIGMSGLARLLLSKKIKVSGSDMSEGPIVEALVRDGADVRIGHAAQHVPRGATVVYSTDIKDDNPEYQAAVQFKCPMMHRSHLLQAIMSKYRPLAVAGTHGKTTTSSLLAWVLESSGLSPSFAIGGVIPQLASNAGCGTGEYFVAEACESDGTFQNYFPFGAIVTNIDFDHMDFYLDEKHLCDAFKQFLSQVSSGKHLFWCGDDERLKRLKPEGVSYGFGEECKLRCSRFRQQGWKIIFDASIGSREYRDIEVSLTGRHNALNALAVFGLALALGIDEQSVRKALATFTGVGRRCEKVGEAHGVLVLDDYGHHPTELKATLKAVRAAIGARRLIAVYQPHRFSRSKECKGKYGGVFNDADLLFVNEIYAAREKPIEGVTHTAIAEEIRKDLGDRCCVEGRKTIAEKLAEVVRPHDVVVTLGAGDVTKAGRELLAILHKKAPPKLKVGYIFGGKSIEHDVSLISAVNVLPSVNTDYYDILLFGITREGVWVMGPDAREKLSSARREQNKPLISAEVLAAITGCDILFPMLHGQFAEDGTVQGFFELLSKAYVGCDYRSSAITMDKALTKQLARDAGIPTLPFIAFTRYEWESGKEALIKRIINTLDFPVFAKAVHLGSTFGVYKVKELDQLEGAISAAFLVDTKVIVEAGLEHPREIEFSMLGNDDPIAFPPGEVLTAGHIHDFDSKYGLNPNKTAAGYETIARLPQEKIEEGRELARQAFRAVGGMGMARVDTFLDSNGHFWLNEINPIPGFTKYSLYHLMCGANGLPLDKLVDELIILGMQRRRMLDRIKSS